eukprot:CAMPEP_0185725164 /NCGR_PEP_ID=MMETSP1171-20130828/1463_1 /TAXON_ID=374046 /ORGANISM="Helicotheca tamensis, Strain CCMP826" /LENGTH=739 /DNA_ID=CAMNT_0028393205 /DNA_START=33 /DNA_END=2249 /DNA_ORIENTATION=-
MSSLRPPEKQSRVAKNELSGGENGSPSLPPTDWMDLLASLREATSSMNDSTQCPELIGLDTRESDRFFMVEFLKHLTEVSQTVTLYALALRCARDGQGNLNKNGEVGDELSQRDKNVILNTRRALRFALSCLSFGRTYDEIKSNESGNDHHKGQTNVTAIIQEEAIIADHCLMHRPLCQLISEQNADRKCRLLAARLLSNLVTSNAKTAAVLAADVDCSPSESIVTKRMLNAMELSNTNSNKNDNAEECSELTWIDMISAAAKAGDRETIAAISAALHNCIASLEAGYRDEKKEGSEDDGTKEKGPSLCFPFASSVASDSALVCNMLRHMLPADSIRSSIESSNAKQRMTADENNSNDTSNGDGGESHGCADAATEWISLVIERLCGMGLLPEMYRSAGGSSRTIDDNTEQDSAADDEIRMIMVTPEQVVLLNCVWRSVEEQMHPSNMKTTESSSSPRHPLGGGGGDDAVMANFRFLAGEVESIRSGLHFTGDTGCSSQTKMTKDFNERYDGETVCAQDAYMTMLEILATSLSQDGHDSKNPLSASNICIVPKIRECLGRETPLLTSALLDLGQLVDDLSTKNRGKKARELSMASEEQRLVIGLVRLMGNLCFRCRYNQDLIRITEVPVSKDVADSMTINKNSNGNEKAEADASSPRGNNIKTARNGLHIILSCTSFSYGCFTLREWALVAIRNILEDNDENRDVVAQLEAQNAVNTPELQKMGVKVDLDKRGKVHVVH